MCYIIFFEDQTLVEQDCCLTMILYVFTYSSKTVPPCITMKELDDMTDKKDLIMSAKAHRSAESTNIHRESNFQTLIKNKVFC